MGRDDREWLEVTEAAEHMGISAERVRLMVSAGLLRSRTDAGFLEVEPAVVSRHGPPA